MALYDWQKITRIYPKYPYGIGEVDTTISGEMLTWNGSTRFHATGVIQATAGSTSFTKPYGWSHKGLCLILQPQGSGAGQWEINYLNFTTSKATKPFQYSYSNGVVYTLDNDTVGYRNVTLTGTNTIREWNGSTGGLAVILASGTVTISGTLHANGKGFRGGAGRNDGTDSSAAYCGEGYPQDRIANHSTNNGNGGGGGVKWSGQSWAAGAGGGGNCTSGSNGGNTSAGSTPPGGGSTAGDFNLTGMVFGGGGGGARNWTGGIAGTGGNGAGTLVIFAKTIIVSGYVQSIGNNGSSSSGATGASGGAGGGAGGNLLLLGETVDIGTNKLQTQGGSGAFGGGPGGNNNYGGNGGKGRVAVYYGKSFSGSLSSSYYGSYVNQQDTSLIVPPSAGGSFMLNMIGF